VVMLGIFGSLQYLGSLLAPFTGVLGDRLGSRSMLLAIRATCGLLAMLIMVLALTGTLTPTLVFATAFLTGLLRPTEYMMRMALVGDIIPADRLLGAMGLSRINIDVARIAGALTGTGLFAVIGLGLSYTVVSCFYVASVALTFRIKRGTASGQRPPGSNKSPGAAWAELKAGMALVWNTPSVLAIMWLAFLVNLTAFPVTVGLLPYVARDIYGLDQIGLGHIVSSYSFGALMGAILMTFLGGMANANRVMMVTTVLWYVGLAILAFIDSKGPGIIVLFSVGLFQSVSMVTSLTALLNDTGEQFRARIMGVRMLAVYGMPLGLVASGYLIKQVGFAATTLAYSVIGLGVTLAIGYRWRRSIWH
jgi:MFS family permease